MGVADHGTAGQTTAAPSLAAWATSVAAALDNSDTTVNARIAAAVGELGGPASEIDDETTSELTTWSSARIVAYLTEALSEALPLTGPAVVFTTTGATFAPVIELASGSEAAVTWLDGATGATLATGLTPTISFGSAETRTVRMRVAGGGGFADVTTLNLGFSSGDDSGRFNAGSGYNHGAQACSGVTGLTLLTGLKRFLAANGNLTGALDFTGLSDLEYIECYGADVTAVTLTGCTSLIRLCMEANALTALNLNPVAGCLYDLRAAAQQGGALALTALTAPMANLYHLCLRDQTVTGLPSAANLPAVEELWVWGTAQAGALTIPAAAESVMAYGNALTSATDAGRTASGGYLTLAGNSLAAATLTTHWGSVDLSDNALDQAAVDGVLAAVAAWDTSNGTLDLSGNTAPSSAGEADVATLQGRGWTVTVDQGAWSWSDAFARADVSGIANFGHGWAAYNGATADLVSGDMVRTDSGAYRIAATPGDGLAPADYMVEATTSSLAGQYFGIIGRYTNDGTALGTRLIFVDRGVPTVGSAGDFAADNITLTPVNSVPASWAQDGIDHTMGLRMVGTTVDVYQDGVHTYTGTLTVPQNLTATGTAFGFCGDGANRHWRSITATEVV